MFYIIFDVLEGIRLQQKEKERYGTVSKSKLIPKLELELQINISEKKERLSITSNFSVFTSTEFTSNIGKLNKGLNINKTKELNYIIISLLNTIPEVIKKAQEFKDKMNEATLYSLEQYEGYLCNFYNYFLNKNPYFILFFNEFLNYCNIDEDNILDYFDDEELTKESTKACNNYSEKNKLYFDFYFQNFTNFTNQIINDLSYLLKLVFFEHNTDNTVNATLPDKYIQKTGLGNNMFEPINECKDFETPSLKISYKKKKDSDEHIKLNTKYNISYTYKIINFIDFIFAYLPLYYSKILKIKICKDKDCIKFYNSKSRYCSNECKNKNINHRKSKEELNHDLELTRNYDQVKKMFDYKIKKSLKYTKKQKNLLETKFFSFCDQYKKYHEKLSKNYSQAKYEKLINFVKSTHSSLKKANTTEEIRAIRTTI